MRPTFYGLEIAKTGLFISQKQLDVTGHNIANVETPGYTRQRLETASIEPGSGMTQIASMVTGRVGGGVEAQTVGQIRDIFLDRQFRYEVSNLKEWEARSQTMYYIDSLFTTELSDYGIIKMTVDFFSAVDEVAKQPENEEQRMNMKEYALTLTSTMNLYYSKLYEQMLQEDSTLEIQVLQINDMADMLARLNEQIFGYELSGERANDLRDKRNILLDELAQYGNITYDAENVRSAITFGNGTLVNYNTASHLETQKTATNAVTGATDLTTIQWVSGGAALTTTTGELKAHIDLRDGNSETNVGLPFVIKRLNEYAKLLSDAFNAIHSAGYCLPHTDSSGNPVASTSGRDFFTPSTGTVITAGNIAVNPDIAKDVMLIAAADSPQVVVGTEDGPGNGANALKLYEILSDPSIGGTGKTLEGYWRGMLSEIGIAGNHADKMLDLQRSLVKNIDNQRLSVSGVSLDEEMTNLIRFNHAYSAASRVITTLDEALDKLINGTGRVGL